MGLDRRAFIKFVVGGAAGTLFTPIPWKLADDASIWSQNWSWIPRLKYGALTADATYSKLCPAGCAVKVKKVAGIAYGVEGNSANELSKGGVCPLCATGSQMLRSPSRVAGPMKKDGDKFKPISWDEAEALLADKLKGLKGQDGKVAAISGDLSGTANEVLSGFLAGLGSKSYYYMPTDQTAMAKAWNGVMGGSGQIGYDLEEADLILCIGADIMDAFGPVVRNQKAFAAKRPMEGDKTLTLVYAGPVRNRTAAVADKWVAVRPDGAAAFAMGLVNLLVKSGKSASLGGFSDFADLAAKFGPEAVAKLSGVNPEALKDVAKALLVAKNPVIVVGSESGQGAGVALSAAGVTLNAMLGSLNVLPEFPKAVASAPDRAGLLAKDLVGWLAAVDAGKAPAPEVLFVYEANPAYSLPQAGNMAKTLRKAGMLVSFSTFMDETAAMADLVLPAPHPFERLDDAQSPYGLGKATYALATAVVAPEKDCKGTPDFILGLSGKLGVDLGFGAFEDVLKAKVEAIGADWDALAGGAVHVSDKKGSAQASLDAGAMSKALAGIKGEGLVLIAQAHLNIGTGKLATPPLNLPTIRETELYGKDVFVQMCAATAKSLGLSEGAKVKLAAGGADISARVNLSEGVMPGVVAAPLGLGRTAWDPYTKGKGDNVCKILAVSAEPGTGLSVWAGSAVSVAKM